MAPLRLTLTPEHIELAYRHGVFPMGSTGSRRVTWHRPDPRAVLPLEGFHVSRSLAKTIRRGTYEVRADAGFEDVMRACADRPEGSWITEEFVRAYGALHRAGKAHSVEAWRNGKLAGGVYGVALGGAFMAESMFHRETDASKVALAALVGHLRSRGYLVMDVQYLTQHLASLGAVEIPAYAYDRLLQIALLRNCTFT